MRMVVLSSGGIDSTLMELLAREQGAKTWPLFVDYGQRAASREWNACQNVHHRLSLPKPVRMSMKGYGAIIRSGLTDPKRNVRKEAFTPGRNLLLLLCGASYAFQLRASTVAIGLLAEETSLFPDQTGLFLADAERGDSNRARKEHSRRSATPRVPQGTDLEAGG